MTTLQFIGLFATGLMVGMLSGFFGVGGGAFLVPVLQRLAGLTWPQAIGLSLTQMVPTSAMGGLRRYQHGEVQMRLAWLTMAGSIPGAWLGHEAVQWLNRWGNVVIAGREINLINAVLTLGFSGMLIYMSRRMLNTTPDSDESAETPRRSISSGIPAIEAIIVGALVGFASALLGIGGGFLFVPIAIQRFGLPVVTAVGTSLFQMPITATAGALLYGRSVAMPYVWLIPLLAGSLLGVNGGVRFSRRFNNRQYRKILAWMLLVTSLLLLATWRGKHS